MWKMKHKTEISSFLADFWALWASDMQTWKWRPFFIKKQRGIASFFAWKKNKSEIIKKCEQKFALCVAEDKQFSFQFAYTDVNVKRKKDNINHINLNFPATHSHCAF